MAVRNYPDIFKDHDVQRIMEQVDYDFSVMEKAASGVKGRIGSLAAATRQAALVWEAREYLKDHPNALVVNLGCCIGSWLPSRIKPACRSSLRVTGTNV